MLMKMFARFITKFIHSIHSKKDIFFVDFICFSSLMCPAQSPGRCDQYGDSVPRSSAVQNKLFDGTRVRKDQHTIPNTPGQS